MTEDHRPEPPPEASPPSREATPADSSNQPRGRFCRALRKFKKNVIKKVSKPFKRSRHQIPAVQDADHEGVSSNQNTEDASRLHPSDGDKPTTPGNPGDSVNQGASGEPASKVVDGSSGVEEIPDPQSVDAALQAAGEGIEGMGLLGKPPRMAQQVSMP
ncbi:hypothetical protein DFJ58DRAFT_836634 [Suillus subalutaceus]|uniref:uncharacterized protein n=1 Tax=Suillus subalutaceus TaxID=48586 RepID=UPI001B85F526|nr:uncharacterized protein DFJ58DRAFT_836634 [Suillus subalutaceus]KAG1873661.1 hypothetical protein DFJ58DRAFT_836634 [Suillus subalutaceus]